MDFEAAKAEFLRGLARGQAGDLAQAERHYRASLALLPGRASTLINLAAAQLGLGKPQDALDHAEQALRAEPGAAEALLHRAHALAQLGRLPEALDTLDPLLAREPQHAVAWGSRGNLLRELGRLPDAAEAYRQALAHGGDAELNGYGLAAVQAAAAAVVPNASPAAYVQQLFDSYAAQFDQHLVQALHYRAPQDLLARLAGLAPGPRFGAMLDLGCGTGLAAPQLHALGGPLTGVDLSAGMLARAGSTGLYQQLIQADAVAHLRGTEERYDLVLATDIFIYIGELAPLFAGVRRVLRPGGWFGFSVEALDDADSAAWRLQASLRYAHGLAPLRALAARHGLAVAWEGKTLLRQEQARAVPGWLLWLRG